MDIPINRTSWWLVGSICLNILLFIQIQTCEVQTIKEVSSALTRDETKDDSEQRMDVSSVDGNSTDSVMKTTVTTHAQQKWVDPEDYNGAWIGNEWIPPTGWRVYSPAEMRTMLQEHSILFLGDSLGRRFMATLYEIINSADLTDVPLNRLQSADVIDVNRGKNGKKEECKRWENHPVFSNNKNVSESIFSCNICRHVPGTKESDKKYYDYVKSVCHDNIISLVEDDQMTNHSVTRHYSLIVIAFGEWEAAKISNRKWCSDQKSFPNSTYQTIDLVLERLPELAVGDPNSNRAVVWRMNGLNGEKLNWDIYEHIYDQIRQHFQQHSLHEKNVHLLDWTKAIRARSNPGRIHGDVPAHYGVEASHIIWVSSQVQ